MAVMFKRKSKSRRSRGFNQNFLSGQLLVGLSLVIFLGLSFAIVWYGSRLSSLTIAEVKVEGGETIDHNLVRQIAEEELKGEYYRLVPRRFLWTYPEETINSRIKNLPRVSAVTLDASESDVLQIYLKEYEPFALWCAGGEDGTVKEPCVFIDSEGQAFAVAPALTGTALLRYRNNDTPKVGDKPFGPTFLKETRRFATEAGTRFNLPVGVVEWIGQEDVSFYVRGGGILKTTLRQPVDDTLNNLNVILVSKEFEDIRPGSFAYIDLRFGDKVFVNEGKDINDETVVASSSTMQ
jgi:hypothetical protein